MGGNDAPAFQHAHPGLALPEDVIAARPFRFGIGHRKIATECGDYRILQATIESGDVARPSERGNRGMTLQGPVGTIAQGQRIVPEQVVDGIELVGTERTLIAHECVGDLGDNFGDVNVHSATSVWSASPLLIVLRRNRGVPQT
jgi:hypothetical protein